MHVHSDCAVQQTPRSMSFCATDVGLQVSIVPGCVSLAMQRHPPAVGLQEIDEPLEPPNAPPPAPPFDPPLPPLPASEIDPPGAPPPVSQAATCRASASATFATMPQRTRGARRAAMAASIRNRKPPASAEIRISMNDARRLTLRKGPENKFEKFVPEHRYVLSG